MEPTISRQTDGWYVRATDSEPSPDETSYRFAQLSPGNALGLIPGTTRLPGPPNLTGVTYNAASPHPSGYVHALTNDMLSGGQLNVPAIPSTQNSPSGSYRMDLSPRHSPTFPLRPITPLAVSLSRLPSSASPATNHSLPPIASAPPQLPPVLPRASAPPGLPARLLAPPKKGAGRQRRPKKRKRVEQSSSEDSGEEASTFHPQESRVRPNMLLIGSHIPPTDIQSVTQSLAVVLHNDAGSDDNMSDRSQPISPGDEQVVESLYEETGEGDVVDLRKLCDLVHKILEDQAELAQNVKTIDTRTRQMATNPPNPTTGGESYVSPPEPTVPINWDQSIQYDAPAGRRRRAKRRVLLMGLIRETIFRLLSRRSVHDPLPPPPPPALRAPTELNFAIRWEESSKSVFNQIAANLVAEKIALDQPGMLTADEAEELPSMVSKHIKYLCRCYREQNRDDVEEFTSRRLNRCGAGTRKRQLFATRLQTLDMFPQSLGKHRHLIVHLGVDGTSSDEEEPKGSGIYRIKNKPQLSSKVTLLKRDLDHVYQLYFKGPGTKGSQVHRRVPSTVNSTRPFLIQGLPLSCISRAWYQGLDSAEKEFYQFTSDSYDFSFPESLLNIRESGWPNGERSRGVSP